MKAKVLILGHGGHGKDTAAEILNDCTGMTYISSSYAALKLFLYNALQPLFGYHSPTECYDDRRNHRDLWKRLITEYNTPDKGRLCREILEEYDCYVGMRCNEEFEATKHLFTLILWIDASKRLPNDPSMAIQFDPSTMILVDNNGAESQLAANLIRATRDN